MVKCICDCNQLVKKTIYLKGYLVVVQLFYVYDVTDSLIGR